MCTLCTLRYAYTDCILALFHFLLPSFASSSSSKPRTLCQPMHTDTPPFPLARNRYRASKYWTGISVTGCYEKEREREISVPASFSLFRRDYRYVYSIPEFYLDISGGDVSFFELDVACFWYILTRHAFSNFSILCYSLQWEKKIFCLIFCLFSWNNLITVVEINEWLIRLLIK